MTVDEEYEQLNAELYEMQGKLEGIFLRVRHLAVKSAEESRRLRSEALRLEVNVYTEKEAAEKFGVCEKTLANLRLEKNLPHVRIGRFVRFTDEHLARIAEMLTWPKKPVEKQESSRLRVAS